MKNVKKCAKIKILQKTLHFLEFLREGAGLMITVAVCDDDLKFLKTTMADLLTVSARKAKKAIKPTFFTDGRKLLHEFKNGNPFDIVILDIAMPHINGKTLAEQLRLLNRSFFLVFMTAYEEEVFNTIRYAINAFIPQSYDTALVQNELIRVFNEYAKYNPEYEIFEILRDGIPVTYKIMKDDILAFCFLNKILYMKTYNEQFVLKERIFCNISDHFKNNGFMECYRNYLINVNRVREISDDNVILDNGEELPLSKRSKNSLLKKLNRSIIAEVNC